MRTVIQVVMGVLLALVVACDGSPERRSTGAAAPDVVSALHTDATIDQQVRVGGTVAFDLPAHAGTGYAWRLIGDPPSFLVFEGDPVFTAVDAGRMGSSGTTRFTAKVTAAGVATLAFEYVRAWEKDAQPVRMARVRVDAVAGE